MTAAGRGRPPARGAGSRERLLRAAKRLMARAGYERVTTAAIAREAGTSESQLVRYFRSKAGLLEAIFNESWTPLNARIAPLTAGSPTARAAMIAIFALMIYAFERDPDLARLLLFEGRRVRADNAEILITQGFKEFAALGLQVIRQGQRDGSFSRRLKPEAMLSALLGAAEAMLRDRLMAGRRRHASRFPETQMRAVFSALIVGLASSR